MSGQAPEGREIARRLDKEALHVTVLESKPTEIRIATKFASPICASYAYLLNLAVAVAKRTPKPRGDKLLLEAL